MTESPKTKAELTVFHDGSCPLCEVEIGYMKRQSGADQIAFVDVSQVNVVLPDGLTRDAAMQRFHVADMDGQIHSGAVAFMHLWARFPRLKWLARLGRLPGMGFALEQVYRNFLRIRPRLSAALRRRIAKRA
ncbi:MAG: DUF393 domain-containing protein [Pseudoprimorskyibacter sp.]|nr:DUF393 domain-containing protein [Pseudoprimorskyibacter sp.]